jgi:two-component system phosphate regulon response regulator PhoB
MSGNDICRRLKADAATSRIPVIFLSAKGEEVDKIVGFELGADDYVTKPFSPRELVLRIKTVLRRQTEPTGESANLTLGGLVIDRPRHVVTFKGKPLDLTPTEFKLLAVLIERRGRVQSRDRLLSDVWEYEATIDTRTVDTHVRRLREKLGAASDLIETVRGVGYRAVDEN